MTKPTEKTIVRAPPPAYERNALYYISDGYDFVYEPKLPFTPLEVALPGHFNAYREELRVGTRITCRLGAVEDGITEVELQVIECSVKVKTADVMVATGAHRKFTPVRHDGTQEDEKEKVA